MKILQFLRVIIKQEIMKFKFHPMPGKRCILFLIFFLFRDCRGLLPFHTTRTLLCMTVLAVLFVEFCESLLTSISFSLIPMIVAILYCWIIHRRTEVRDACGTALSAGIFVAISLSRAWKLMCLSRSVTLVIHLLEKLLFNENFKIKRYSSLLFLTNLRCLEITAEYIQIRSVHDTRSTRNHSVHRHYLWALGRFGLLHVLSYGKLPNDPITINSRLLSFQDFLNDQERIYFNYYIST